MSTNGQQYHREPIQAVYLTVCSKYKEMYGKYRTVKLLFSCSLTLYFQFKTYVNLPQKLSCVVSALQLANSGFLKGFSVPCYKRIKDCLLLLVVSILFRI